MSSPNGLIKHWSIVQLGEISFNCNVAFLQQFRLQKHAYRRRHITPKLTPLICYVLETVCQNSRGILMAYIRTEFESKICAPTFSISFDFRDQVKGRVMCIVFCSNIVQITTPWQKGTVPFCHDPTPRHRSYMIEVVDESPRKICHYQQISCSITIFEIPQFIQLTSIHLSICLFLNFHPLI